MSEERAPYGRERKRRKRREEWRTYDGATYYDLPVVKASYYKWLIAVYFWVGGIAGAASILAAVGEWLGRGREEAMVRAARYVAFVGSAISPILLILDLHTPQRFYNMLRIFRITSPLSFGTWIVSAFGVLSALTAGGQAANDLFGQPIGRRLARLLSLPMALAGAFMTLYTALVLVATSVPLWAALFRQLPILFASAAMSTGSAALSLILTLGHGPARTLARLEKLSLLAAATEALALGATERQLRRAGLSAPLATPPASWLYRVGGMAVGVALPLAIHMAQLGRGRHSRPLSLLASVATLGGGFALRAAILLAGNQSTQRPELYFTLTQAADEEAGA